mmetsp:Transcript_58121/g.172908  ORF Transcript_58121/g.172908 Transcript_58121/m.172908 type:complete len:203 (-) Transcript_58121:443-1051(-)
MPRPTVVQSGGACAGHRCRSTRPRPYLISRMHSAGVPTAWLGPSPHRCPPRAAPPHRAGRAGLRCHLWRQRRATGPAARPDPRALKTSQASLPTNQHGWPPGPQVPPPVPVWVPPWMLPPDVPPPLPAAPSSPAGMEAAPKPLAAARRPQTLARTALGRGALGPTIRGPPRVVPGTPARRQQLPRTPASPHAWPSQRRLLTD